MPPRPGHARFSKPISAWFRRAMGGGISADGGAGAVATQHREDTCQRFTCASEKPGAPQAQPKGRRAGGIGHPGVITFSRCSSQPPRRWRAVSVTAVRRLVLTLRPLMATAAPLKAQTVKVALAGKRG